MGMVIFIVGTDTGVGKTLFTCGLTLALRREGRSTIALKPVETGFVEPEHSDAHLLALASGNKMDDVILYRFAEPLAPLVAAELEGKTVDVNRLKGWIEAKAKGYEFVLVEVAGGLAVPIAKDLTFLDLIADVCAPAMIVGRNALGVINHVLLTYNALQARGVPALGVILNEPDGPDRSSETNPRVISKFVPCLVGRLQQIEGAKEGIEHLFGRKDFVARFWFIVQMLLSS